MILSFIVLFLALYLSRPRAAESRANACNLDLKAIQTVRRRRIELILSVCLAYFCFSLHVSQFSHPFVAEFWSAYARATALFAMLSLFAELCFNIFTERLLLSYGKDTVDIEGNLELYSPRDEVEETPFNIWTLLLSLLPSASTADARAFLVATAVSAGCFLFAPGRTVFLTITLLLQPWILGKCRPGAVPLGSSKAVLRRHAACLVGVQRPRGVPQDFAPRLQMAQRLCALLCLAPLLTSLTKARVLAVFAYVLVTGRKGLDFTVEETASISDSSEMTTFAAAEPVADVVEEGSNSSCS